MADPLGSTTSVAATGGFASRFLGQSSERRSPANGKPEPPRGDRVEVVAPATLARGILRERVLARTRDVLGLAMGEHGPVFAEAIETESVDEFLGRLLSAQNQLAAVRVAAWGVQRTRGRLGEAFAGGAAETLDLLVLGGDDGSGAAQVAEVLAAHARRLAALANDGRA